MPAQIQFLLERKTPNNTSNPQKDEIDVLNKNNVEPKILLEKMDLNFTEFTKKKVHLFFLPFIYFYVLSIGLLGTLSYMVVKDSFGIRSSYAQENTPTENLDIEINIDLSKTNEEIAEENFTTEYTCNPAKANKIDNYFSGEHTSWSALPLTGHGCDFDFHGHENGVNPVMIAAIAMCESTGGKVTPQFQGKESYNAWGWAVFDNNDVTKDTNGYACDSWEHCIGRVTRGIARNSLKRSLTTEPIDVVTWYNPGSVNRAGGIIENSSWYQCVTKTMNKIEAMSEQPLLDQ